MSRVLVTGASGLIGSSALPQLVAGGWEVHAISSKPVSDGDGVTWHRADLLDAAGAAGVIAAVRPSHLLHLAWYAVPGDWASSPQNVRWVGASLSLLQAFAEHGGQRAVFAGSCAEYDLRAGGACREDGTPLRPASLYGTAKLATSDVALAAGPQFGCEVAWGRVFYVFGPHEHPGKLVPTVIRSLLRGEPVDTTSGTQERDYLYVGDVADALVHLLAGTSFVGPVNIGSGVAVPVASIVRAVGTMLGREDLLRIGALPSPADDVPVVVADTERLRAVVGRVQPTTLEDGLTRTIEWWRTRP